MLIGQDANETGHDSRLEMMRQWIESDLKIKDYDLVPASADASFRRYFRLSLARESWVIMDAPPEKEDCAPFIKVAKLIESAAVHAPHIENYDAARGFMQLSDLGSTPYLNKLNDDTADALYEDAIRAICRMQTIQADLPPYDKELLHTEMALFKDWYLQKHLGLELNAVQNKIWQQLLQQLSDSALQQSQGFVHRDYHSRNLMLLENDDSVDKADNNSLYNPGVIDFQDAVNGPISYDLVSLIKDCYIAWPRHKQLQWIDYYLQQSIFDVDQQTFIQQLDFMGLQRHLKAIGIFARLNHRDAKPGYLNDIPRTLAYVFDVCQRYPELNDFYQLLISFGLAPDQKTRELIA